MATIRLVPSTYTRSNTNYVTVNNADNMYHNTDNTSNYATLQGRTRNSSTAYYAFIGGFNFGSVPSDAIVSSFTVKIKAFRNSYQRTGTNFKLRLTSGSTSGTVISGTTLSDDLTTTADVYSFPNGSLSWSDLTDYGNDFSIEVPLAGSSGSYAPQVLVYGAEIEVTYAIPIPRTVTTSLTGSGTIVPSGTTTLNEGENFNLTITPTNKSDNVTATKNNVDITEDLEIHYVPGEQVSDDTVLGTYHLVSGGFNGSGASYFSGIVGHSHTSSTTTSNYYSSSSSTQAVFTYDMGFTLPSGAEIVGLYVMVNGHAESTSQASEYMCAQLICGNIELSDELNFKSIGTSNSTQTIHATTLPSADETGNIKLRCRLGYYGGAINGATCYITYTVPTSEIDHYSYDYVVDGDASIIVTIGGSGSQPKLFTKINGTWVEIVTAYKKINGAWVVQSDITNVFQSGINYKNGGSV